MRGAPSPARDLGHQRRDPSTRYRPAAAPLPALAEVATAGGAERGAAFVATRRELIAGPFHHAQSLRDRPPRLRIARKAQPLTAWIAGSEA